MSNRINELFSIATFDDATDWKQVVQQQYCPFIDRQCVKVRKSQPEIAIGTCSVNYGKRQNSDIIICPHRFLSRGQVFFDCLHLLTLHEPGNELHIVPEVEIPGGSVDYFLVSVQDGKVVDFVGVELQALDTTGTVWPTRQQFLQDAGVIDDAVPVQKSYGMNWKMTAKTTLMQIHHKIETFESLGKHLVLVLQDVLMSYMRRQFSFDHIQQAKIGHSMHFHSYNLEKHPDKYRIKLISRASTNTDGVATALGLQVSTSVQIAVLIATLERKISDTTRLEL